MLLNIWSLFFDFIYASAVISNAEVSTSSLKSFNEIVHFLSEYHKTKAEASVDGTVNPDSAKAILRMLFPVWKIVWKTWCNIGHNIGPNKLTVPPVDVQNGTNCTTNGATENGHPQQSTVMVPPPNAAQVLQQLPSQAFLCLLIKPLFYIFPKIASHFADRYTYIYIHLIISIGANFYIFLFSDFKNLSFVLQNAIATPFLNEPSVYNYLSSDQSLTQLQVEVITVLERMQEQILELI